jgi:hypothetical protein
VALSDYDSQKLSTSAIYKDSGNKNLSKNELFPLTLSKSISKKEESVSVTNLINNLNLYNVVFRVNIPYMNFLLLREVCLWWLSFFHLSAQLAENFMAAKWGESRLVRCITRILLKSVRFDAFNACITSKKTYLKKLFYMRPYE